MLRPLYVDLFDVLVPMGVGVAALFAGRGLHRLPATLFRVVVGLAVALVLVLGGSYFVRFPEPVNDALWHVGGEAEIAGVIALFLLGVVWESRGRSTSDGFLRSLAGMALLMMLLTSGGRLWWRTAGSAAWDNGPDASGCLTQTSGWTCSPAAAAMLMQHHGVRTTEGEMAYLANTSFLGTNVRSIAYALTQKGMAARLTAIVVFADFSKSSEEAVPFLACIQLPQIGGHAVLILRMTSDEVELIDPRFGRRQVVARSEIEPQWDGKIVYLVRAE